MLGHGVGSYGAERHPERRNRFCAEAVTVRALRRSRRAAAADIFKAPPPPIAGVGAPPPPAADQKPPISICLQHIFVTYFVTFSTNPDFKVLLPTLPDIEVASPSFSLKI